MRCNAQPCKNINKALVPHNTSMLISPLINISMKTKILFCSPN